MLTFERLFLKIFNQDLFINIKTPLKLALSMWESENNFINKPKPFKVFISGKENSQKCISMAIISIKTFKLSSVFWNCPIQKWFNCCLDVSTSEDDIRLWLNSLSTMFSNLSHDASGSCNIFLGQIHNEHLTNWNFSGLFSCD